MDLTFAPSTSHHHLNHHFNYHQMNHESFQHYRYDNASSSTSMSPYHYYKPIQWSGYSSGSPPSNSPQFTSQFTSSEDDEANSKDFKVHLSQPNGQCHIPGHVGPVRIVKRRVTANKKERRRTQSINSAFSNLRDCIPNVPADTKLSKIKTLRLATSYIAYLMELLDGPCETSCKLLSEGFRADLTNSKRNNNKNQVFLIP